MEAFVLWVLFSFFVAAWASNRGRSFAGYFLLCLIVSPLLGFLIAALVGPNTGVVEEKAVASGDQKKCPFCAELIKAEAIKCRYCGESV